MGVLWRVVKASIYATLLLLALGVVLTLMVWSKGLFGLVVVFGLMVGIIYNRLKWREHAMRKEDRKW